MPAKNAPPLRCGMEHHGDSTRIDAAPVGVQLGLECATHRLGGLQRGTGWGKLGDRCASIGDFNHTLVGLELNIGLGCRMSGTGKCPTKAGCGGSSFDEDSS